MSYQIKTEVFEGPLDLLLHLIKRMEIDIYDIPMAEITDQYLLYIHTMKELELDQASEYLVMSATLLSIKSKMLLPKNEEVQEDETVYEEEDPRTELVEQLIEYKRFKEAAMLFRQKESVRSEIFTKPPSDLSHFADELPKLQPSGVTIYDMIGAFNKLLRRKRIRQPLSAKVARPRITIQQRMDELLEIIEKSDTKLSFSSFFHILDREFIILTFLAMLELMKSNAIIVWQSQNFEEIYISSREESLVLESS
ncbi:segregation and condensation protein A [Siminovitchia terrae]|uniref:Segregation and condensation protein A n=1 Tax=Siminovitchia terrae TaxID=1914933 RepID=A0A429XCZ6_SIMTE|nr:segregation/condensation protein A [Siminovitchia terrae]RST61336.1 segregation/condensation protein A [Siminovitchia terrae]GIN89496.1 segregation and condensation protein A [Siminovitchia terrae]GIN96477.1 segregation and condensation protein A [Siminovitchia terrae]